MPVLLDFEARSRCDLKKRGGRNYAADPSTEVLCCVLHDTDKGVHGVWLPGDPCPVFADDTLAAHNADGFDRFIAERLGWPARAWVDTSVLARRAGLPGALDALASRWLGARKDLVASRFTKSLSRPSRAKKSAGALPEITAAVRERVVAYCASDVEILVHGWPRLASWLDMGDENEVYAWDRAVNDRGVAFDSQLARRLLEEDERNAESQLAASARTLGWTVEDVRACVGSPSQLTEVLGKWGALYAKGVDENGEAKADAKADTLERLLADTSAPAWVRALIQARQAIASIARGKLEAGLARVSPDGRLRDNLRYYGAHTGRWSGRGMQLQNMPRPAKRFEGWGDDEVCREADRVLAGGHCDQETVDLLLRATLHAKPGHVLVCEDFSSVEARGNAWAANDRKALRVFEQGLDVYKVIAAIIFGVSYDAVNKTQRQVGKVAELACLGPDTVVLTDRGPCVITEVCLNDRLWDGTEWVSHRGLVQRGIKPVVACLGVEATNDHLFYCGTRGWCPFEELVANEDTRFLALESASAPSSFPGTFATRRAGCSRFAYVATAERPSMTCTTTTCGAASLRGATRARRKPRARTLSTTGVTRTLFRMTLIVGACSTGSRLYTTAAAILVTLVIGTMAGVGFAYALCGVAIAALFLSTWSAFRGGMIQVLNSIASITTADTRQETCALYPAPRTCRTAEVSGRCKRAFSIWKPVYDIAHVGPRNRFTILSDAGPLLVHNCGYGMGWKKLHDTNAASLAAAGVSAKDVVRDWRSLHAPIVRMWAALERGFLAAARGARAQVACYEFVPSDDGRDVACFLPSGRPIVYNDVLVTRDDLGREQLWYRGSKKATKYGPDGREKTWGGTLCENVTQALCRDLMARAGVECERRGLQAVLSVHDELLLEVPRNSAQEAHVEVRRAMRSVPEYAEGFPIGSDGHVGVRYRK